MKIFNIARYDITVGILYKKRKYFFVFLFAMLCQGIILYQWRAIDLRFHSGLPGFYDYVCTIFGGNLEDVSNVPLLWMIFNIILLYTGAQYFTTLESPYALHSFLRAGNVRIWWLGKCIFSVVNSVINCLILYASALLFTVLSSGKLFGNYQQVGKSLGITWTEVSTLAVKEQIVIFVFLIPLTVAAIGLLQTLGAILFRTYKAFLGMILWLLGSVYVIHPIMIGNGLMVTRSEYFMEQGLKISSLILLNSFFCVAAVLAGYILIKWKYESAIINK